MRARVRVGIDRGAMLEKLTQQPPDALLALIKLHDVDPRHHKIDLGVGVYRTGQGETPVFGAIKAAEQKLVDEQMRIIAGATATSTVASGETAQAMLAEMLAGRGLIYRAAGATTGYGLPGSGGQEVGQITKNGLRPFPLDDSFRAGLAACGIAVPPVAVQPE